jgi:hypothetical protein
MALLGIEEGINSFLEQFLLNKAAPANLKLILYTNNHTPVATDVLANFTECTDTGYSAQSLTGGNWTMGTDGSGNSQASYPAITFTFNGNVTIYGYVVTDNGKTKACWAEAFSSSISFTAGQQLVLTLKLTLS